MTPRKQVVICPCGSPVASLLVDSCRKPDCLAESIRANAALDRLEDQ